MPIVFLIAAIVVLILVTLKYPVVSLAFFLTTSVLKGVLMVNFSFFRVVDFTVLCASYTLLAMGYSFVRAKGRLRHLINAPTMIYLLLAVLLLLGATYTSAPKYGLEKSSRFATFGLIAFMAPLVFVQSFRDIKVIYWILIAVGVALAITTIVAPDAAVIRKAAETRGSFFEANPLETAVKIGVAAIIVFCFVIMMHTSLRLRIASIAVICLCVIGIIVTASRGPFAGLLLTWIIALLVCRRGLSKGWFPIIAVALCMAVIVPFITMPEKSTRRIAEMFLSGYDLAQTAYTRSPRFQFAFRNSWESPVGGHGTGAFAADWDGRDQRSYPHNMILELFYEQGFIGVMLGGLFLLLIFRRWRQAAVLVRMYEMDVGVYQAVHIAGLLFLFTLMQAMKSGDLDSNRFMFFCAGMVLAALSMIQRQIEQVGQDDQYAFEMLESQAESDEDVDVVYAEEI